MLFLTVTAAFICGFLAGAIAVIFFDYVMDREYEQSPLSKDYD